MAEYIYNALGARRRTRAHVVNQRMLGCRGFRLEVAGAMFCGDERLSSATTWIGVQTRLSSLMDQVGISEARTWQGSPFPKSKRLNFLSVRLRLAAVVEFLRSQQDGSFVPTRSFAKRCKHLAMSEMFPRRLQHIGLLPYTKKRAAYQRAIELARLKLGQAENRDDCHDNEDTRHKVHLKSSGLHPQPDALPANVKLSAVVEFIRAQDENTWAQTLACARYYQNTALGELFTHVKTTVALDSEQRHRVYARAIQLAKKDAETNRPRP